jgi:prepilin-type N-terminal cleavage/methylation domain-containing protein
MAIPRLSRPRQRAFTLVELLVVIGIIVVLISILLPVVTRIRTASYEAATRQEIGQIVSACQNYHQDFRAYPGPISNSDIEYTTGSPTSFTVTLSSPSQTNINIYSGRLAQGATYTTSTLITAVPGSTYGLFTASQNLVLGLLGGLWNNPLTSKIEFPNYGTDPLNPSSSIAAPTGSPTNLIGTGPQSLLAPGSSLTGNKQYTSYMSLSFPGSTLMLNGDGSPETGMEPYYYNAYNSASPSHPLPSFGDSVVPVFTDQFPDHLPILFVRARVGAHGILSGPVSYTSAGTTLVTDPTTLQPAQYNYDLRELVAYTWAGFYASSPIGLPSTITTGLGIRGGKGILLTGSNSAQHGLQGVKGIGSSPAPGPDILVFSAAPDATYGTVGAKEIFTNGWNSPVPTNTMDNGAQYFLNSSIAPTNTTNGPDYINATGTPRGKDEFVIISAGRDRTYGTADDLTSFGDVEP